jgi:dienelactone hydrolase
MADARFKCDGHPKPVVIFNHGFKGFKDWGPFPLVADAFAQAGFVFIKVNFSHNGVTKEKPTEFADLETFSKNNFSIELDDTGVLLDALFDNSTGIDAKDMDLSRLFIAGHSRGGASAILKAAEDSRVKKVATWAAVSNLETWHSREELEYWKQHRLIFVLNKRTNQKMPLDYQLVEDYQKHRSRLNVPEAVKKLQNPMIALHGSADETVPVAAALSFKEWNPSVRVKIIDNANHTFGADHPFVGHELPNDFKLVVDETIRFFGEQ